MFEFDAPERLHKYVRDHVVGRTVLDHDMTLGNGLMDEVEMHIDMLHLGMKLGVFRKFNCTLVVAVKSGR